MSKLHKAPNRGPWMQTYAGTAFFPNDPAPEEMSILDIGHALSNLCRYTGHCHRFYSVAEHSVLVSYLVPEALALEGLLHDASEAYLGDVASPLKRLLPDYRALEDKVARVAAERFGLAWPIPPEVKAADMTALNVERRFLLGYEPYDWQTGEPNMALTEKPQVLDILHSLGLPPADARALFMARFAELTAARPIPSLIAA